MTATTVNGHAVITDKPTASALRDKRGNVVYWPQTRTLTLDNGDVVYGCVHCDYTSLNENSIRPHLGKHRDRPTAAQAGELSLNQLLERLGELDKVTADRDQWRKRAVAAEKSLSTLRKALGVRA